MATPPTQTPVARRPSLVGPIDPGEPVPVNPVPAPHPDISPTEAREHPEKVGKPDNVPHDVIGLLAFSMVMLAVVTLVAYLVGGLGIAVVLAGAIAFFTLIRLSRRASRERTEEVTGETDHGDRPPPA